MKFTLLALATAGLLSQTALALDSTSRSTICGVQGYDNGVDSYWDSKDGSYNSCSAACSKQATKCKSFAYGGGACYLYDRVAVGNFEEDSGSPYTFYDASCGKSSGTTGATSQKPLTSTTASTTKQISSTVAKTTSGITTITKPATTATTIPNTTLATSTTKTKTAADTGHSCSLESVGSCTNYNFTTFTDPCNKGCGCTYKETCGGSITGGDMIDAGIGFTYSDCILACDSHQPSCVGVQYNYLRGACYLYKSITGTDAGNGQSYPGQQTAIRQSCSNACPAARTCYMNQGAAVEAYNCF